MKGDEPMNEKMKVWFSCPICGTRQLKIDKSKHIEGVYIKCRKCGNEIEVNNEPESEPEPVVSNTA